MSSTSNREQFVKQLDTILEGIRANMARVDVKRAEVKSQCDLLKDEYASLTEKKRLYYKTLKDFQEVIHVCFFEYYSSPI